MASDISFKAVLYNIIRNRYLRIALCVTIILSLSVPIVGDNIFYPLFKNLILFNVEESAKRTAAHLSNSIISQGLKLENIIDTTPIVEKLEIVKRDFNIRNIRLYDPTGKVIYSTYQKEMGQVNHEDYFVDQILEGKNYTESFTKKEKLASGKTAEIKITKVIVPQMEGDLFLWAFEIEYDITKFQNKLTNIQSTISQFQIVGIVLFLIIVFWTLIRSSYSILRKNAAEKSLKVAYKDLEQIVEDRTVDLKFAKEKAESANIAKAEFLSNMTHELRTPMHQILSFAGFGITKLQTTDREKLGRYFTNIKNSAQNLMLLLENLLNLSNLESEKTVYDKKKIDLGKITQKVLNEFETLLSEKKIKYDVKILNHNNVVTGDPIKMERVIRNLLKNALKFTPKGGSFVISLQDDMVELKKEGQIVPALLFTIADNGVGIPADEVESIFEKFTQSSKTKTGAGGTGLGLAICKRIIDDHQGVIWAENKLSGGAIFRFKIPIGEHK